MIDTKIIRQLEFDKIIEALTSHAETTLGKEATTALKPSSDYEEVLAWQKETDEAVDVLRLKGPAPFGGIRDIRQAIKRVSIGGVLNAKECLDIADTLYGGKRLKAFIAEIESADLPYLKELTEQIEGLTNVEQAIKMRIDDNGHVVDHASDKLRSVRSQIRSYENSVREKLERYTRTSSSKLSDAIVTIRNDRYVLPVKQEHRGSFGGIVHDQSSSGQTLFIEPESVVQLNNQLSLARVEEAKEVERILASLSEMVQEVVDPLEHNVKCLQKADFLFAKGQLAYNMKAAKPKMNDEGYIKMLQARHPLIPADEVVPNDVELGKEYRAIVITGPNTGGKTVTLKLVGLCTLMAQAGLHVPAMDGCELAVFDYVFADIGDEQSIEQNLSTFSSHMTNIVSILKKVNSRSLVLFDELGAGTDPQEGAGLAMSILDFVVNKSARVIATTHYPELKAYGYNREHVTNASVEFDSKTLQPTYRLLIGVPGRSNAFEISARIGLQEEIIDQARSFMHAERQSVEHMIASLEDSRKKVEEDYAESERVLEEAQDLYRSLKQEYTHYLDRKEKYEEKAKQKAEKIIEKAEKDAESILEELREMKDRVSIKDHELIDLRKKLTEQRDVLKGEETTDPTDDNDQTVIYQVGDEVHVRSFNQKGEIVEILSDDHYEVQLGILKMKVPKSDLQLLKRKKEEVKTRPMAMVRSGKSPVKPELDLRGERYEDALNRLEKYLDLALLAGYNRVSIIHGKGTGALMKGVHTFARTHPNIESFNLGHPNEGGSGVTILTLK